MNHNRLHVCLKSALLFAIPIGLLAVFAQPSGTHSDSIVVFAPHPDDEVIGCAGIIMQALARGARVKVVAITSGDGFPAARALPWPPPRRVPLTPEQAERKLKSIQAHNIPVVGMPQHQSEMESFVKSEEVFWTPLGRAR